MNKSSLNIDVIGGDQAKFAIEKLTKRVKELEED